MSKSNNDLSALFRSLRPDDTPVKDSRAAVGQETAQHWPLLKTVVPEKPFDTPLLSVQERQRWTSENRAEASGRKPALSLPGLSDKMSDSLVKMSVRAAGKTTANALAMRHNPGNASAVQPTANAGESPPAQLQHGAAVVQKRAVTTTLKVPFPEPNTALGSSSLALEKNHAMPTSSQPNTQRVPNKAADADASANANINDSLKSVFSRIGAKKQVVVKPMGNRSSFMDRLGKR